MTFVVHSGAKQISRPFPVVPPPVLVATVIPVEVLLSGVGVLCDAVGVHVGLALMKAIPVVFLRFGFV
jgi:hypothetical protein